MRQFIGPLVLLRVSHLGEKSLRQVNELSTPHAVKEYVGFCSSAIGFVLFACTKGRSMRFGLTLMALVLLAPSLLVLPACSDVAVPNAKSTTGRLPNVAEVPEPDETVRGEEEPMEYTSPPLEQIVPKNSPLWKTKPALQLYYNTLRDWARMYFPDVIMGVYTDDEIETHGPQAAPADGAAAKPSLTDRIKARSGSTTATTSAAEPAEQPNAAQWAQYLDMLAKARTQDDVRGLYDDWFGPSSPVRWTDYQAAEAGELATTRIAELPSRAAPARDESSAGSAGSKKKSSG